MEVEPTPCRASQMEAGAGLHRGLDETDGGRVVVVARLSRKKLILAAVAG